MGKLIITGGKKLSGEIRVSGSKNAALPIICASLLANQKSIIKNVPKITDVLNLLKILKGLGVKANFSNNVLEVDPKNIKYKDPNRILVKRMRASVLLVAPLLSRFGKVKIPLPGGCFIGARPITTHLNAFIRLGVKVRKEGEYFIFEFKEKSQAKKRVVILDEMSVTGTENILIFASLLPGTTEIRLAALEPEIEDLSKFLNSMGAKIKVDGIHTIKVEGVKNLKGTKHLVIPDRIEAGTWAILGAINHGHIKIVSCEPRHLDTFFHKLKEAGVNFKTNKNSITICPSTNFNAVKIRTSVYPAFPTDLQAPFSVLMTQANGISSVFETMYSERLNYLRELNEMGADATIENINRATVKGPTPLFGKKIKSLDLRAGVTLILAALIANGISEIENAETIERGYENIEEKLKKVGAEIKRAK